MNNKITCCNYDITSYCKWYFFHNSINIYTLYDSDDENEWFYTSDCKIIHCIDCCPTCLQIQINSFCNVTCMTGCCSCIFVK